MGIYGNGLRVYFLDRKIHIIRYNKILASVPHRMRPFIHLAFLSLATTQFIVSKNLRIFFDLLNIWFLYLFYHFYYFIFFFLGHKWRTHRKLIAPTFHLNVLKSFIDLFNENSRQAVRKLQGEANRTFDAHDHMSEATVEILLGAYYDHWFLCW